MNADRALRCTCVSLALPPGLRVSSSCDGSRVNDQVKLVFQELQRGNEAHFISGILGLLRTQERVFTNLGQVLPEVEDPVWLDQRVPAFRKLVDELVEALRRHVKQVDRCESP